MQYAKIEGTELCAGKIVLGTDRFGSDIPKEDAFRLMDMFLDGGGNLLDTAHVYADWKCETKSASEKTIGAWVKERGNRDKVILSTKGGHPDTEHMDISRLSKEEILSDLEGSLRSLGTDYVDLYWLHKDDEKIPAGALCEILNEILSSGKARAIGVSNWRFERICEANEYAQAHGLHKIKLSQVQYSIARVNPPSVTPDIHVLDEKEYEEYVQAKMQVFAFSSQARGYFSLMGKGGESALSDSVRNAYANEYNRALFSRLEKFSKDRGVPCSAAVLAALFCDSRLSCFALASSDKPSRLSEILRFADFSMSDAEREALLHG